jgi:hypothetical protein
MEPPRVWPHIVLPIADSSTRSEHWRPFGKPLAEVSMVDMQFKEYLFSAF